MNWGALVAIAFFTMIGILAIGQCVFVFAMITARAEIREQRLRMIVREKRIAEREIYLGISPSNLVESDEHG